MTMVEANTKTCRHCGIEKPVDDFPRLRRAEQRPGGPGHKSLCKPCYYARERDYNHERRIGSLPNPDGEKLDIAPFRAWLHAFLKRPRQVSPGVWSQWTREDLAAVMMGVGMGETVEGNIRRIHRWLNDNRTIRVGVADQMLCACNQPQLLNDLYPLEETARA